MMIAFEKDGTCDFCGKSIKWADVSKYVLLMRIWEENKDKIGDKQVRATCGCQILPLKTD